jgi:ABC-type glycerol-3-phosphate transport system substrate-binding protein
VKKTKALVVAVLAALTLTACGTPAEAPGESKGSFRTTVVNVDGRGVQCVTWKHGYAGGVSCDW